LREFFYDYARSLTDKDVTEREKCENDIYLQEEPTFKLRFDLSQLLKALIFIKITEVRVEGLKDNNQGLTNNDLVREENREKADD